MSTSQSGLATAEAPESGRGALLSLRGITKTFGPVRALTRVDLVTELVVRESTAPPGTVAGPAAALEEGLT